MRVLAWPHLTFNKHAYTSVLAALLLMMACSSRAQLSRSGGPVLGGRMLAAQPRGSGPDASDPGTTPAVG